MSEFIKKLGQVSRGNEQPMGFGPRANVKIAPMMLVAQFGNVDGNTVNQAISGGADALLFDIEEPLSQLEAISQISGSAGKAPWGVRLGANTNEEIDKLADAGCDYVVMTAEVPAQLLMEDRMGKVLETYLTLGDGLAEAVSQVPIDAIFIADSDSLPRLTISRLLDYQRICAYSGKLAVVNVPQNLADLDVLLEAGVGGVMVGMEAGRGSEILSEARKKIQNLSGHKKREREENHALLPRASTIIEDDEGGF
ncbi:hypothetical protein ACFLU3_01520 [Chloroflexota bacterium]